MSLSPKAAAASRWKRRVGICTLCPRNCKAERAEETGAGVCRMGTMPRIARAALHMWEEPCISGTRGSGAVFFSGCGLRCVFCQNERISQKGEGKQVTPKRLSEIFRELEEQGAHNINLVTAAHFVPAVLDALALYRPNLPIVYNSSGYESVETLRMLDGAVDIYLPDLKYFSPELSAAYSHAPDYFEIACAAIAEMYRQVLDPVMDPDTGLMQRGMIVRHLLLPGQAKDSKKILRYLHETYGDHIYISIMNQYTPLPQVADIEALNRTVTPEEYDRVLRFAERIGIEQGFRQEGSAACESFIPEFDERGL